MPDSFQLTVNGKSAAVTGDANRSLLEVLREDLQLTGTKYGCGEGACGACTVLVDGKRIFSCSTPTREVVGKKIQTIEGLAPDGDTLHPVQKAFCDEGAFQCGYCTAGMIMTTVALLGRNAKPTDGEIADWMNGNICRCCSHLNIMAAVKRAAGIPTKATETAGRNS
jgi:aerobic-type carbon monoxide dehydrogenase small subunit (CoxS/CutS family)